MPRCLPSPSSPESVPTCASACAPGGRSAPKKSSRRTSPSADLDAHRQAFGGGQHRGTEAAAARQLLVELAQGCAAVVAAWPVDLAEAECVVGEHHAAFAKMVAGPGEIG